MRKDWIEFKIPEIISKEGLFSDGDWVESKDQDPEGEVRLIQLADIGDGKFLDKSNRRLSYNKSIELKCSYLQKGDLLVARMPKPLGRSSIFPLTGEKKYVTVVDVAIIRPFNKSIYVKYLLYILNSPNSRKKIEELQSGTTRKRISKKNLSKINLPLSPLPEQKAIVAKIEQLFSDLDNGIANLKKAQTQLKIYRQAVLKKAFEGELTSASEKITKVPFGNEVKIVSGKTPKAFKYISNNGKFQFYKVSDMNLAGNEFEMKTSKFNLTELEIENLKIKKYPKGTVIFPKRGGAILTNKKRILSQESSFDLNLMGVIPNENVLSKYLYYFFLHQDLGKICDGSAVPQINNKNIAPLNFPKCDISEQTQIIQEIESRLSVCDNVEANIKEALTKAESLRQSILKKAFEGRLLSEAEIKEVRNDPEWEPAEKLLERIQSEKAKLKKQSRGK